MLRTINQTSHLIIILHLNHLTQIISINLTTPQLHVSPLHLIFPLLLLQQVEMHTAIRLPNLLQRQIKHIFLLCRFRLNDDLLHEIVRDDQSDFIGLYYRIGGTDCDLNGRMKISWMINFKVLGLVCRFDTARLDIFRLRVRACCYFIFIYLINYILCITSIYFQLVEY